MDSGGNAYITGYAASGYPTTAGAYDKTHNGAQDVIVTKLNSAGTALSYSTFIGTGGTDISYGIAVDSSGNAYITGRTGSGYPTTSGAYDEIYNDDTDAFVSKFVFPSIPTHDDGDWNHQEHQNYDADTNAVDILNSGNTFLEFQQDSDYVYFQFHTVAVPDESSYTYAVLLDDGSDGTYDYAIASYGESNSVSLYKWSGSDWDNSNVLIRDVDDFNIDTTNNVVQFAVASADSFAITSEDTIYAATYDTQANAFEEGQDWEGDNDPMPTGASEGDYTTPELMIPEFPTLAVPVAAFFGIVGLTRYRRRCHRRRRRD